MATLTVAAERPGIVQNSSVAMGSSLQLPERRVGCFRVVKSSSLQPGEAQALTTAPFTRRQSPASAIRFANDRTDTAPAIQITDQARRRHQRRFPLLRVERGPPAAHRLRVTFARDTPERFVGPDRAKQ